MDNYPPRPPPPAQTGSTTFSRIDTVSDYTEYESFHHGPNPHIPPSVPPLQTSVDPYAGQHTGTYAGTYGTYAEHYAAQDGYVYAAPAAGWTSAITGGNVGYSPISTSDTAVVDHAARDSRGYPPAHAYRHHDAIPEEDGADIALVKTTGSVSDDDETEKPRDRVDSFPMFDVTSMLGPTTQADQDFLRALQEQEAHGKLTGGLGTGFKSETTVTESALLASSPTTERPLSRTFSRIGGRPVSRIEAVKKLGQEEANKRGEVIEVVLEDSVAQSNVDLSLMSGQSVPMPPDPAMGITKQPTFPGPKKSSTTALFFPQPNWKPFSMRWPWLAMLIVLSLAFAVLVEFLYRRSTSQPLIAFRAPSDIPTEQYFAIKFLPMIVAVLYGVLWQVTFFDVMRLEPFYQLSKESGALAAESLNVDYLTQFNLLRPFRALRYRHWAVVVSSVASLLANTLVPTLGAATIFLSPDRETRLRFPDGEKRFLVHHVWARLLIVTLVVIAALGCVLFYQLKSRRSGLLADVKGIAGLAAMATVSHILMDFKDMDVATHKDIHDRLKHRRYFLRNACLAPDDGPSLSTNRLSDDDDRYTRNHLSVNPRPLMLRPLGAVPFLGLILIFAVLLPVVLFTPASAMTDRTPWALTAIAVLIKLSWGALETNIRLLEPYYILSRRHAPPRTLCLDYTTMPFGWVTVRGLLNKHWMVFAVGLGSIVAEVLTVLVTSLATVGEGRDFVKMLHAAAGEKLGGKLEKPPGMGSKINAGQETVPSFWASLTFSIIILLYLFVVGTVALVRRGGTVFLPRQPNTIASVLAYIHQSKMLYGFVGTARLSSAELARRLEKEGKTYGLGWFRGRDGMSHCGVDEEELLSGYKVGYDYSRATKPWDEEVVNWL
ncbi:hypothetical protein VTJ04DRAFT_10006 [Mycothermus thermophilus]|uniref:uncharacterized protein n=1 Tax=Humicola insolens TaxID=85995 RepID=UPI0037447E6D